MKKKCVRVGCFRVAQSYFVMDGAPGFLPLVVRYDVEGDLGRIGYIT